ncbi:MAG: adenine deaminase [Ruminococcaceae bacterium]|nr:adenine deaminase [Oscillospiraceae bacterium]
MINKFCKKPLYECTIRLAKVATGAEKADLVIQNARLVNVCTHEIMENISVAVADGRIALVGDASHCIGENTTVIDAENKYLAPAFMDGHIHIESSMLTVGEYAKAVVAHGTSGVFIDPHEICNVLGLDGVNFMMEDAKRTPLKTMLTTPSCVPAVGGFEDTGAKIDPEDVALTMDYDCCVGLGEMMNFPGILGGNPHTHGIVGETLKAGKIPTGHYSIPETGSGLNAYIASGLRCCHESTRAEDALAKMRLGMYAMLREGSAWHDLHEVAKAITEQKVDSRFACLISDDTHPHTLIRHGHLDYIVRRAIEEGVDPITAIQMVTINVAQCFQLDHEMGSVAPSKCADLVLIDDLNTCHVTDVFIDGELVAKDGKMTVDFAPYTYPEQATHSVHLDKLTAEDFKIPCAGDSAKVHAIEVIPARVGTFDKIVTLPVCDGGIEADSEQDVLKVAVFERHHKTGTVGKGFIKGFGIKRGALAQTVAHDAHNLLVAGSNDEDMALAANTLIECGGGLVAVLDGKVLSVVPLPIAGLMSDKPIDEMSASIAHMEKTWQEMGSLLPSPFMTMALIPLACLPETRLTNRGLVDCRTFEFIDLIVE